MTTPLCDSAMEAVAKHANSHIGMALAFAKAQVPAFLSVDADRLVKVGRSLENLVALKDSVSDFDASLQLLVQECSLLASGNVKVPTVRFGRTNLQMSILTLGCMRFQQEWGPRVQHMNQVSSDCQDNLLRILKRAIVDFGMTHIETARAYGCSELQLGVALQQLYDMGLVQRQDLILQTKVNPAASAADFRKTLETSFKTLQVDYVDLFAFHGINMAYHYEWVFGEDRDGGNCMDVIKEYVAAGKIRHVGFSTHGPENLIRRLIETNEFDYVNLHYHYFGSYTTTGVGETQGNLENIRLMKEKDMGVFCISPMDKGGKLYEPSNKLRTLCLPDMEPMAFGSAWLWNHANMEGSPVHTIVVGAARPADLDQAAVAAYLQGAQPGATLAKVQVVTARLEKAKEDALTKEWLATCYQGVPKSNVSKYTVEHNQIIWCYNNIKAFGMLQFARDRYGSLEGNRAKWDKEKTPLENIEILKNSGWGYVPGLSLEEGVDYSDDFEGVPEVNKAMVLEAEAFVHKWCKKPKPTESNEEESKVEESPFDWQTAYAMKPWVDFPDRPRS
jgi:uncharacterized protein